MGIKHSSRCMLLRRKMAESESGEVSARHLGTFCPSVRLTKLQLRPWPRYFLGKNLWIYDPENTFQFELINVWKECCCVHEQHALFKALMHLQQSAAADKSAREADVSAPAGESVASKTRTRIQCAESSLGCEFLSGNPQSVAFPWRNLTCPDAFTPRAHPHWGWRPADSSFSGAGGVEVKLKLVTCEVSRPVMH